MALDEWAKVFLAFFGGGVVPWQFHRELALPWESYLESAYPESFYCMWHILCNRLLLPTCWLIVSRGLNETCHSKPSTNQRSQHISKQNVHYAIVVFHRCGNFWTYIGTPFGMAVLKGKTRLVADPSIGVGVLLSCIETYVEKFGVGDIASKEQPSQHWMENLSPVGWINGVLPSKKNIELAWRSCKRKGKCQETKELKKRTQRSGMSGFALGQHSPALYCKVIKQRQGQWENLMQRNTESWRRYYLYCRLVLRMLNMILQCHKNKHKIFKQSNTEESLVLHVCRWGFIKSSHWPTSCFSHGFVET